MKNIIRKEIIIMTDRMTREPLSMGAEISPIDVRDYHLACTAKEFPA
jgi:hypothetical protein